MTEDDILRIMDDFEQDNRFLAKNFNELQEHYPDSYIAIYQGQLIAVNSDLNKLIIDINRKEIDPTFTLIEFIPKPGSIVLY